MEQPLRDAAFRRTGARWWAVVASVAMLFAHVASAAQREVERPVVIGGDASYAPFHFLDGSGAPAGFDVELARAVAADQNLQVRFELGDWDDALQRLERGSVDVVPMFVSAERARRYLFTKPYLMRYHAVFGPRSRTGVASLEELAGTRVAVQRAGLAWEALGEFDGVQRVEVDEEAEALAVVARGGADYALVPTGIGHQAINDGGFDALDALSPPLLERRYAFAVRRDRPDLAARLDAGLDHVRKGGAQDRLYVKWLGGLSQPATAGDAGSRWKWWLGLLLLVPVAWAWRRTAANGEPAGAGGTVDGKIRNPTPDERGALAELPDRRAMLEQLAAMIEGWRPGSPGFALAKVHLLGLDLIEDIAGEATHNDVQAEVANRLVAGYGAGRVALLGPGSLGVILPGTGDRAAAEQEARQLARLLLERMNVRQLPVELRSRIGIAVFPTDAADGGDARSLARAARIACEAAQKRGVAGLCYHAGLEPDPRNLTLLTELREAIAGGTLGYQLQPKLDLRSRQWSGAELLVRWDHPRHGRLSPGAFVPLAEQAAVIGEMTLYLVRHGLKHCRRWQRDGHALTLSVNISANDLADPALVQEIVQASGDRGGCLMLEVTETDVMRDPDLVVEAIAHLRRHGIRISVDDFGTGHSSLTNLRRLAPDELKIDQSFVFTLLQSPSDQAIVRATIRLGHDLGAIVTAEGIEDGATLRWLAEAGCDVAQGFGVARPMDPAEFDAALGSPSGEGSQRLSTL